LDTIKKDLQFTKKGFPSKFPVIKSIEDPEDEQEQVIKSGENPKDDLLKSSGDPDNKQDELIKNEKDLIRETTDDLQDDAVLSNDEDPKDQQKDQN